jgi:hypothetical protein
MTRRLQHENFKLGIAQIGNPETVGYVQEAAVSVEPRSDEVEILVRAVAIDSCDYRRAMGKTKKVQFGNACAGTITMASPESGFELVIASSTSAKTRSGRASALKVNTSLRYPMR